MSLMNMPFSPAAAGGTLRSSEVCGSLQLSNMSQTTRTETGKPGARSRVERMGLGLRLRQFREAAGLTQAELAGDRFSKEYVSQIERGKTKPTAATIEWLARRLELDPGFLATGVASDDRARVEAVLTRAEAFGEAHRFAEAAAEFGKALESHALLGSPELRLRALSGRAWAFVEQGDVREGISLLGLARDLVEGPGFSDLDRATVLFRLGVCRYKLSSIASSLALLTAALDLAERSGLPCDQLRSEILSWRSRCYRRQRDIEAAREDVERALELAEALGNRATMANVYVQASLVAERTGHWLLARTYAEKAKSYYEELNDERNVAGLLNNLGGLNLMLGNPEQAVRHLKRAFGVALEADSTEDAAQAAGSLAKVHLETGDHEQAEQLARHALELLDGRDDYLHEIGPTQLVLGRSLLEQGRLEEAEQWFGAAEKSFEQLSSASHRAAAWIAFGDLAARRGDDRSAARLYRRAAETLQDVRF
jgi:tetratricopeptide (TPR) repeat protein